MPDEKPEGATLIFILGILGVFLCGILGIIAWVQGNDYLARCRAAGVEPDGLAVAGRILGIIATVLLIIGAAVTLLLVIFAVFAAAAA